MTNEDWVYAAGIIDGEGTISGNTGNALRPRFQISVYQKHPEIVVWLRDTFGGKVYPVHQNGNTGWSWKTNRDEDAKAFLQGIQPFLKLKQRQAELGLRFLETCKGRGTVRDERTILLQQCLITELQTANQRQPETHT